MAWLDALRGLAALSVVYEHLGARVLPAIHTAVFSVFDPGLYGVLVFFLISGYIVPGSLERMGSVRAFWISRVFRLFPLFLFVIAATLVLHAFGLASLDRTNEDVPAAVFGHLFMLNDLLGGPNLIVVIWTLSYEMVFYLLITALFTVRLHQRSSGMAVVFGAGALGLGGLLPTAWLSRHSLGLTGVAMLADGLVIGGLAVAMATRRLPRALGAWLAAGTALILVLVNEHTFGYERLAILALMFAGTVLYRAQHGQVSRGRAAIIVGATFAAAMAAGAWHIPAVSKGGLAALHQREWVMSVALAGLTFAAGLALQNLRVPSALAWLGLVSYSAYLGLPLMLDLYDHIPFPQSYQHQAVLQAGASAVFLAALLTCAAMTYHLVEAPMQRLGKRTIARLDPGSATTRSQAGRAETGLLRAAGSRQAADPSPASWRAGSPSPERPRQLSARWRAGTPARSALRCTLGRQPGTDRHGRRTGSEDPARNGSRTAHRQPPRPHSPASASQAVRRAQRLRFHEGGG